ncbi:MAG: hypothetical protein ACFFCG_06210 [Promethearchaeota archaeon]
MKINRKISSFLITTLLFLSILGLVIARTSQFNDFTGEGHGSCHGNITQSGSGYISLSSSSGSSVNPSETFIITIQVLSFTEAQGDSLAVGFPSGSPGLGNNKDFSFNATQKTISISGSGDSATVDFQVTAPATEQTYTLHSDAIYRASGSSSYFAHGDFIVTVKLQNTPPQFNNLLESSDPLEFGQQETFQVDVTDSQTSVSNVFIELEGINRTMSNLIGNTFEYNWTPSSIGMKNYIIYANDTDGSWNSTSGSINVIDTTLPNLSNLIESEDPLELGQTETIYINATDSSGISHVLIDFSGVNNTMTKISDTTWEYNSWIPTSTGVKAYTIYANDTEGNWNSINSDITVIDTIAPTYSDLIESADTLPLGQNETISINVYDTPGSGVNEVILEYDNVNHTMIFMGVNTWIWSNWKPSSIGIFNYNIYMKDNSNNLNSTSGSIDVFVSAGPIIQNVSKSADPLELGELETIEVDIIDADGISTVFIEIGITNYTMEYIGGIRYEFEWSPSSIGTKLFTIHANDSLNNWNQLSDSISVQDTRPPNYANLVEDLDPLELGNALTISIDATDLTGINQVKIEIDGVNITMSNVGGNTWSNNTWRPLSVNIYPYTIYIQDNSNNWNSTTGSIEVIDTISPELSNLYEEYDPMELGLSETIQINITDLAPIDSVLIEIEALNYTMTKISSSTWEYNGWIPTSTGLKLYTIYANDSSNNRVSLTSNITVIDTTGPALNGLSESADPLELGLTEIIQIQVEDFSGISHVLIENNGVNYTMAYIGGTTWEYNNWIPTSLGIQLYTIYANDTLGNWISLNDSITVTDTLGPTIINIIKSAESIFLGQSVSIQVDVTDISGTTDVIIEHESSNQTMTYINGNTWEIVNLTPSTSGVFSFTIYARDSLGNWNLKSDTITVNSQDGIGDIGINAEDFDLIVIFSTVGILGILVLVIVIILRPKRFIK